MANKTYTVTITEAENKALEHTAYSVQDWVDNAIHNRARLAIDSIYNEEVERMTADPSIDNIPADKDQVVLDADLETAKDKRDRLDAEREQAKEE